MVQFCLNLYQSTKVGEAFTYFWTSQVSLPDKQGKHRLSGQASTESNQTHQTPPGSKPILLPLQWINNAFQIWRLVSKPQVHIFQKVFVRLLVTHNLSRVDPVQCQKSLFSHLSNLHPIMACKSHYPNRRSSFKEFQTAEPCEWSMLEEIRAAVFLSLAWEEKSGAFDQVDRSIAHTSKPYRCQEHATPARPCGSCKVKIIWDKFPRGEKTVISQHASQGRVRNI